MPQPERLLPLLRRAAEAFRATPGRRGHVVQLGDAAEVCVAGDLHGNVANFARLLQVADLAARPRRHLVLQEVIHGKFRYPDGGDKSHQALDLLAALTCQFPGRVHFLPGNHELSQWTNRRIGKDRANRFRWALAEASEVTGALDAAVVLGYLAPAEVAEPLALADRIRAMTFRLTRG